MGSQQTEEDVEDNRDSERGEAKDSDGESDLSDDASVSDDDSDSDGDEAVVNWEDDVLSGDQTDDTAPFEEDHADEVNEGVLEADVPAYVGGGEMNGAVDDETSDSDEMASELVNGYAHYGGAMIPEVIDSVPVMEVDGEDNEDDLDEDGCEELNDYNLEDTSGQEVLETMFDDEHDTISSDEDEVMQGAEDDLDLDDVSLSSLLNDVGEDAFENVGVTVHDVVDENLEQDGGNVLNIVPEREVEDGDVVNGSLSVSMPDSVEELSIDNNMTDLVVVDEDKSVDGDTASNVAESDGGGDEEAGVDKCETTFGRPVSFGVGGGGQEERMEKCCHCVSKTGIFFSLICCSKEDSDWF
jgi:hypothetical protein